jgi:lipopolysaccharide export system protein LptA
VLTCLLLFIGLGAMCQPQPKKASVVNLISSERSFGFKSNGADVIKVYHGTFRQDYSILRSDSAYFYPAINSFDAFGHVNINQGDTLNIYSDKLNYNGNTHIALLTDNVKMVDKDATLTTNYLTYNTATRVGTYTGGGKLVNKDNTLTSINGYYFAYSRDSYFRYNAVLTTVDAVIKTDTLRYNTGTRIAFFYGPTHIYGKKNKDTLYTENGTYNTITEQAFFGKKNLYTQNTKSLKGDSLFYDRLKGYGRAVKNVVFNDTEQKITMHGQLGTYYQNPERTVVTQNPWVTIVTEEKDTTKTDTVVAKTTKDSTGNKNKPALKPVPNTKPLANVAVIKAGDTKPGTPLKGDMPQPGADTLLVKKNNTLKKDSVIKTTAIKPPAVKDTVAVTKPKDTKPDSKPKVETAKPITGKDSVLALKQKDSKKNKNAKLADVKPAVKDTVAKIKRDTIYLVADTLETRVLTFKALKDLQEERRLAAIIDTSAAGLAKRAARNKKPSKFLDITPPRLLADTSYHHSDFFGPPRKTPTRVIPPKPVKAKAPGSEDKIPIAPVKPKIDSVNLAINKVATLSDTSRIRILFGHHNAKIFKSDLQAKADSLFYSSSDSTIRCYVNPIIWSQGSQMSGDTVYLQMKNKKLDNMDIFYHSFIVNVEDGDTTHFNQVAGKKMRGFFTNDKLSRIFVDGNAERIYFSRDSLKKVDGMYRSLSSRIRANFKDNKISNVLDIVKTEHRYGPPAKFTEDDKILKGFIWKPKERPVSKEAIIPELDKTGKYKHTTAKPPAKGGPAVGGKGLPGILAGKDSVLNNLMKQPGAKDAKDNLNNLLKQPANKAIKDTLINKAIKHSGDGNLKDTSALLKQPAIKAIKDSVLKKIPAKVDTVKH